MKFNKILTTALVASLFTTGLYAESNKTVVPEAGEAPVVGGAIISVSVQALATTGYRASKLLGAKVYNENNDTIGSIDDFIVAGDKEVSFAIISVGGFLGLGARLVAVPASLFKGNSAEHITLPKATKDDLVALPAFTYAK
jgi:sporulation protein YlmC with PRC-barrel domain